MHIPDGFMNGATSAAAGIVAAGGVGVSVRRVGRTLQDARVAVAGLVAAFVFAAQMVNIPVAAGTTGHLVGAVLAAVLLGPAAAVVIMAVVVVVQALVLADGGLTALGLNLINLALVAPLGGYLVFRALRRVLPGTSRAVAGAAGLAGGTSVVMAAAAFSVEYALGGAGAVPFSTLLAAMVGVHVLIGALEGFATALVVEAVLSARPDLVAGAEGMASRAGRVRPRLRTVVAAGMAVSLAVAVVGSQFAADDPDGLERVAADTGISAEATPSRVAGPLTGYGDAFQDERVGTGVAGLVGTLVVFGAGLTVLEGTRRMRARRPGR